MKYIYQYLTRCLLAAIVIALCVTAHPAVAQDSESTQDWRETYAYTLGVQAYVSFDHQIPAPGVLPLLGLAGLMGTRRRRG